VIALVDYGAGNLTSVRKALSALGASVWTPSVPGELARAHGIIVPGVGHFDATRKLTDDWRTAIKSTIDAGTPVLGICIGLQWLFEGSTEADKASGLGHFKGMCDRLTAPKVPHVGWNSLLLTRPSKLMAGIDNGSQVYFTHSFAAPVTDDTVATCEYGSRFTAAVERGNVAAVQFHPEKSGDIGLAILHNWLKGVSS
jgi:glutamine amidotransferase